MCSQETKKKKDKKQQNKVLHDLKRILDTRLLKQLNESISIIHQCEAYMYICIIIYIFHEWLPLLNYYLAKNVHF